MPEFSVTPNRFFFSCYNVYYFSLMWYNFFSDVNVDGFGTLAPVKCIIPSWYIFNSANFDYLSFHEGISWWIQPAFLFYNWDCVKKLTGCFTSRKFTNLILNAINCVTVSVNLNSIYMYSVNFVMETTLAVHTLVVNTLYINQDDNTNKTWDNLFWSLSHYIVMT